MTPKPSTLNLWHIDVSILVKPFIDSQQAGIRVSMADASSFQVWGDGLSGAIIVFDTHNVTDVCGRLQLVL